MIGVVLLPQLLFFWLAPQDAAARWAVYIVGTVLTFLLTCMSFGVCWYVGVRRGAAMAAVSGVFDAAVVGRMVRRCLLRTRACGRRYSRWARWCCSTSSAAAAAPRPGLESRAGRTPPRARIRGADAPAPAVAVCPCRPGGDNALNRRGGERHGSDLSALRLPQLSL